MATIAGARTSLELVPLGRLTVKLAPPLVLENTPSGTRYIIQAQSGRLEGDRIHASVKSTQAGDWLTVSPDGTATLDVRATLETDDGALIFCHYNGRADMSKGAGKSPIYAAPLFDTGDPRYGWLNKIQAVVKGAVSEDMAELVYEVFELR